MIQQATELTIEQMTRLHEALTAAGWPVELVIEDAIDEPCLWDEAAQDLDCPKWVSITWGDWTIESDGELQIGWDHFPVNDCDLAAFIADAHKAWHAVGGPTIRDSEAGS